MNLSLSPTELQSLVSRGLVAVRCEVKPTKPAKYSRHTIYMRMWRERNREQVREANRRHQRAWWERQKRRKQ